MEFIVDEKRKKKMQKAMRKLNKAVYITYLIERTLLFGSIFGSSAFVLYCLITNAFVSTHDGTGEKGYFLVTFFGLCFLCVGMTAWIIIWFLQKRLEQVFVGNKVGESLKIEEDKLLYLFRTQYETSASCINFLMIDLHKLNELSFDNRTGKIVISGQMIQKSIKRKVKNHTLNENEMIESTVEFFDYFTPSLYETIKGNRQIKDGLRKL